MAPGVEDRLDEPPHDHAGVGALSPAEQVVADDEIISPQVDRHHGQPVEVVGGDVFDERVEERSVGVENDHWTMVVRPSQQILAGHALHQFGLAGACSTDHVRMTSSISSGQPYGVFKTHDGAEIEIVAGIVTHETPDFLRGMPRERIRFVRSNTCSTQGA
jgi:hypothetical protein